LAFKTEFKCKTVSRDTKAPAADAKAICHMVSSFCQDGERKRGAWANVAGVFPFDPKTVACLSKDFQKRIESDEIPHDDDHDA